DQRACGERDQKDDGKRAGKIDEGKDVALGQMTAQPAGQHGADDVEETDHAQGPAADLNGKTAIDQIGGQMQGNEAELETAGEKAEDEQEKRAVPEGLGQSLTIGLCAARVRGAVIFGGSVRWWGRDSKCERD